jgi:glycosyltransferase involved in cell wall biosynthesis
MKIDVAMITKNSEHSNGHIFEKCLRSVYEEIPADNFNNLIVVDGCSTDGTIGLLNGFKDRFGNVRILRDGGTRATARQKCIDNVETEWFAFVDSDVVLCPSWFERALKYIKEDVGAIWGVNLDVIPNFKGKFFYNLLCHVSRECFEIRGGTHDTLIRRDAVKGIRIPPDLRSFEDAYIIDWIKKGYEVVIGDDLYCKHFRPSSDWGATALFKDAYEQIRYGLGRSRKIALFPFYPIHMLYGLVQFKKTSENVPRGHYQI